MGQREIHIGRRSQDFGPRRSQVDEVPRGTLRRARSGRIEGSEDRGRRLGSGTVLCLTTVSGGSTVHADRSQLECRWDSGPWQVGNRSGYRGGAGRIVALSVRLVATEWRLLGGSGDGSGSIGVLRARRGQGANRPMRPARTCAWTRIRRPSRRARRSHRSRTPRTDIGIGRSASHRIRVARVDVGFVRLEAKPARAATITRCCRESRY
jgi:hypothetical protein